MAKANNMINITQNTNNAYYERVMRKMVYDLYIHKVDRNEIILKLIRASYQLLDSGEPMLEFIMRRNLEYFE